MSDGMVRRESGLLVPPSGWSFWEHRKAKRTVRLRDGRRALVTVDDSGTVMQVECGDRLDAVVRPKTIRVKVPVRSAGG